ncbi:MAG: ABC transporter substrate-binding protein [Nitrososphaerales archaeon]
MSGSDSNRNSYFDFSKRKSKKRFASLFAVAFLLAVSALSAAPALNSSAQSSAGSCPSSDTLHLTFFAGIPTSFNSLAPFNPPGVFAGLLAFMSAGAPVPYPTGQPANSSTVADVITHNSNYTVWTVHVRPGTMWWNGRNVSSADYLGVFSANFALNPAYDPIGLHSEITQVNALNDSTTQFVLNQTDAHFAERIDSYFTAALYPKEMTALNATANGFNGAYGDGPFYLANYSGSGDLVMLRNPHFQPQPKVCAIIWNFVEQESQTATYLAAGTSDFAPVAPGSIASLQSNPNIHILQQPGEWMTYLQYNVSVYPYNMTQFRQALAFGVNQSQIAQFAFNGYATPAYNGEGTIAPGTRWYQPNQVSYSFNQTKSLDLLKSIGFTQDSSGNLHYPNGTAVSVTLWAASDIASNAEAAQFVSANLKSLGIQVNTQITSISSIIGNLFSNGQNIQHQMIVQTSEGLVNTPYYMSQPAAFTWEIPGPTANPYVAPASANAEYQGNLTGITGTDNATLEGQYINNIQSIYAANLPTIPLDFVGNTVAYSTLHFTNWPSGYMYGDGFWNATALANITPVGQNTSTTSSSLSTSSTSATLTLPSGTTQTISSEATTFSTVSSTSTNVGSGLTNTTLIAIGVIVVIIVVALGLVFARRKTPAK